MILSHLYRRLLRRRSGIEVNPGAPIIVVTRSMNEKLYGWSQSLLTLPYPRRRITGLNHWRNATDYLHALFEIDVEWLINMDEDCFVINNDRIAGLLAYMQENDYDFCGNPDGGVCIHRFHNPVVTNPFFNIFNVGKIRPALRKANLFRVNETQYDPQLERFTPTHLLREGHDFAHDNFECYYGFFFWLLLNGFKPLYLPSIELADGLTTELRDHENVPFLYHTWFTRKYGSDEAHTKRIDSIFQLASNAKAV